MVARHILEVVKQRAGVAQFIDVADYALPGTGRESRDAQLEVTADVLPVRFSSSSVASANALPIRAMVLAQPK